MKRSILGIVTMTMMSTTVLAQNVTIPDANFKAYLLANTAINTNSDSEIQISEAAAFSGQMDCGYLNISDLTGLEAFSSLTDLRCYGNSIASLDVSQNSALEYLNCGYNGNLVSLNTGALTSLHTVITTDNTSMSSVDFSQNTALETLDVTSNELFNLDVTQNTALKNLTINFNHITTLDLSNNPNLLSLSCFNNTLTSLDLSNCPLLSNLACGGNSISSLDLSALPGLFNFSCNGNNLIALDVSNNPILSVLRCENNSIQQLDVSQNVDLAYFTCQSNELTSLNMKNLNSTTLGSFDATSNPNLTCIEVDDVTDATTNWTDIDATASFSLSCSSLGLQEANLHETISVSPNPTSGEIRIRELTNQADYQVVSLSGQIVKKGIVFPEDKLNIEDITPGVYFIHVQTDNKLFTSKFIKK